MTADQNFITPEVVNAAAEIVNRGLAEYRLIIDLYYVGGEIVTIDNGPDLICYQTDRMVRASIRRATPEERAAMLTYVLQIEAHEVA